MIALLRTFSLQEWRHHPWRHAAAMVAIMLGVALSFGVHLINASALSEFSQAVRSISAQADLEVRASGGDLDESVADLLMAHPDIRAVQPVLEAQVRTGLGPMRLIGVDLLGGSDLPPGLRPLALRTETPTWGFLHSNAVLLNPAAQSLVGQASELTLLAPATRLEITGGVGAPGPALLVMDIAAAQDLLGRGGALSRIDLYVQTGTNLAALKASLQSQSGWPAGLLLSEPGDGEQRMAQLSRAYRVNLTVLALVALFTGAFLVFSVLSLSVAQRAQQFALLGVLGCSARERLSLVLMESALMGVAGSLVGLALGTVLATAALRVLGGDLGGGYFSLAQPTLHWQVGAAVLYGLLGVLAAVVGGWWPARHMARLPVVVSLKGLGQASAKGLPLRYSLAVLVVGMLLALLPPIFDMPLGAYVSVAACLLGGIMALPALTASLLDRLRSSSSGVLSMLAIERAHRQPHTAAAAVSGVVAALSLAVALTVMVASFRQAVMQWLDVMLPADLYVRSSDGKTLDTTLVQQIGALPGVSRIQAQTVRPINLDAQRAPVVLIARELGDVTQSLPMVEQPLPASAMAGTPIYVSEAMRDLYAAQPGQTLDALAQAITPPGQTPTTLWVAGVWRDYARQSGTVMINRSDYLRLSGDARISDLAVTTESASVDALTAQIRQLAEHATPGEVDIATTAHIRAISLRLFDRSFAVTYWLQAVAIGIGLFGIAASFSAQVLARRKEFGLLAHLGVHRAQIWRLVALEGAVWTGLGALAGLLLGVAVSVILVHVINPQSFHWTMPLQLPYARLLALCAAVLLAGTLTAWLSGKAAASQEAVLAVKEDW